MPPKLANLKPRLVIRALQRAVFTSNRKPERMFISNIPRNPDG